MVDFEKREPGPIGTGMILGLLLILGGALLFLDNLNILPFETAGAFWPLALIALSGVWMLRCRSAAIRVWAGAGVIGGILLLLGNYHFLRVSGDILWPLALIATGIVMLIHRLRWKRFSDRFVIGSSSKTRSATMNRLEEVAVFSAIKRKLETPNFEGGELSSAFGSIEIDLRLAGISSPGRQAVVDANAAFGSIELRIPGTWRVQLRGSAVFGAYEDKTIPPRPEPGVDSPTLVIRGGVAFGSVEIRN